MTIETSATVVVVAALITALATELGAMPFLFVSRLARSAIGVANALAARFTVDGRRPGRLADALRTSSRRAVVAALVGSTVALLVLEALLLS